MARGEVILTLVLGVCLISGAAFRGLRLRQSEIRPYVVEDAEFGSMKRREIIPTHPEITPKIDVESPEWPRDINLATAEELTEARGIGASLSAEIVSYRETHGPFRRMDDLLSVPGIGPSRLTALKRFFEVREEVGNDAVLGPESGMKSSSSGSPFFQSPGVSGDSGRVNINHATREDLERLPRIGPVLAGKILEDREKNGYFHSESDIMRVSGIGPATYRAIVDHITVRP